MTCLERKRKKKKKKQTKSKICFAFLLPQDISEKDFFLIFLKSKELCNTLA